MKKFPGVGRGLLMATPTPDIGKSSSSSSLDEESPKSPSLPELVSYSESEDGRETEGAERKEPDPEERAPPPLISSEKEGDGKADVIVDASSAKNATDGDTFTMNASGKFNPVQREKPVEQVPADGPEEDVLQDGPDSACGIETSPEPLETIAYVVESQSEKHGTENPVKQAPAGGPKEDVLQDDPDSACDIEKSPKSQETPACEDVSQSEEHGTEGLNNDLRKSDLPSQETQVEKTKDTISQGGIQNEAPLENQRNDSVRERESSPDEKSSIEKRPEIEKEAPKEQRCNEQNKTEESQDVPSPEKAIEKGNSVAEKDPKKDAQNVSGEKTDSPKLSAKSADVKVKPEAGKVQIAATLNQAAVSTTPTKSSQDTPLLSSPTTKPGVGILGPAPSPQAPFVPRGGPLTGPRSGPPSMFSGAMPINIPPPPMDVRLPTPPQNLLQKPEEFLKYLKEIGMSCVVDGSQEENAEEQKRNQPPKFQQRPNPQQQKQQQQQQPQNRQNNNRESNWRQRSEVKGQNSTRQQRGMAQGMVQLSSRQSGPGQKRTSPQSQNWNPAQSQSQAQGKPGLSTLTKDELEKEYQWQKFSVERKVKKVLKSLPASSDEDVVKELLAIVKTNPSKLANFPWPKEQYVVLEKLIEHAILATEDQERLQKRVATIINSLQDMHPQGFKEDFRNAMVHAQGEFIQGSSSDFRRKQARAMGHFIGDLHLLSRSSSPEFKASVQAVVMAALREWIKSPSMTSFDEDSLLLLEVYAECLKEFLVVTLREDDDSLKKQVSSFMKEEILSATKPKPARELLVDALLALSCQRCSQEVAGGEMNTRQDNATSKANTDNPAQGPTPNKATSDHKISIVQTPSPPKPNVQPGVRQQQDQQQMPPPQQQQQQQQQHHQQQQQQRHQHHQKSHPQQYQQQSVKPGGHQPAQPNYSRGRTPPGQYQSPQQISNQQMNAIRPTSVPSQSVNQIAQPNPQWPAVSQGMPEPGMPVQNFMQGPPAAAVLGAAHGSNYVVQNAPHQPTNPGFPNQAFQSSLPQAQQGQGPPLYLQSGGQTPLSRGVGATLQMIQSQPSGPQGLEPQTMNSEAMSLQGVVPQGIGPEALGTQVSSVAGVMPPQGALRGMLSREQGMIPTSMMQATASQQNPQIMSNMNYQQMIQTANVQTLQPGPPVSAMSSQFAARQESSQYVQGPVGQPMPQVDSPLNFQQNDGSSYVSVSMSSNSWQQSSMRNPQEIAVPGVSATSQGLYSGQFSVQKSVMPHNSQVPEESGSFAKSAASGTFLQNTIQDSSHTSQNVQQTIEETRQGVWDVPSQGSSWPDKTQSTSHFPTSPPPHPSTQPSSASLSSSNQSISQWSSDAPSMQPSDNTFQNSSSEPSGWGRISPAPKGSSNQKLGTDGWGSSDQGHGMTDWGSDSRQSSSWTTSPKPSSFAQQNEQSDGNSQGHINQKKPGRSPRSNASQPKDDHGHKESTSSYPASGTYTLPSKHKEGSPAAEGVSYSAMSELGSYGIDPTPGGAYDAAGFASGYVPIGDGGGYGDSLPPGQILPGGQQVGQFILMPEAHKTHSASPENFEVNAIKECFQDDEDLSIHERQANEKLRQMRKQNRPDWTKLNQSSEEHSKLPAARQPRGTSRRGQGRGSMLINPAGSMPPMSSSHQQVRGQNSGRQNYSPRK